MQKLNTQKGITLIALVITIIVMMILVGVSVTVALNGGLFSTAKKAAGDTEAEKANELALSDGRVKVNGTWYDSLEAYERGERSANQGNTENEEQTPQNPDYGNEEQTPQNPDSGNEEQTPTVWTETTKEGWSENVKAMTDGTNIIPLPNGFEISEKAKERTVDGGLVVKDGLNEFVWIPVANSEAYLEDGFGIDRSYAYSTPPFEIQNTQDELDYWYGTNYYDIDDFTFDEDKTKVEESINKYGGFYVGRYETTIDGSTIGVQQGKNVLTSKTLLKEGTNTGEGMSEKPFYYRWWGIYDVQKDMYANNGAVGSLMISSKQWDEIMTFTEYGDAYRETKTYSSTYNVAGAPYANDPTQFDICKNIFDLAGNVCEFVSSRAGSIFREGIRGRWL